MAEDKSWEAAESAAEKVGEASEPVAAAGETAYEAMEPARDASAPVTSAINVARTAVGTAATAVGGALEVATSFLSAVPAMLLVFPSTKVPIPIPMPLQFKPEELTFSKAGKWIQKPGSLKNASDTVYGGGEPEELDLDLFFDETDTQLDVRVHTTPLRMLATRNFLFDKPPLVMFMWGTVTSKMSYVSRVDVTYTFFRPDGTPLRAKVKVHLKEWHDKLLSLAQNPTTRSEARKTWVVTEGQTLDWIAYQEYNDPAHWRHIAEVNNLDDPLALRPGQILKLTPIR
jgi:nucleoid-associated protein YgaU